MGGQAGNRGYLLQTVVALLKSLEDDNWISVSLEPNLTSEKVDILWTYTHEIRAVQVKSSINQINQPDVERWAKELKQSFTADFYELILIGPCSQGVTEIEAIVGVRVPPPKNPDFNGLLNEAAHLLDKFLVSQGLHQVTPVQRELMAGALVAELSIGATSGHAFSRIALAALLKEWINTAGESRNYAWEEVNFDIQRGIEHAVAGQRLGPADVDWSA